MAGAMDRRVSQYDVARQQASQRENETRQQTQDAINRRLAAQGGGPGGVGIKLQQQSQDESAKRLEGTMQTIDAAERGEAERKAEVEAGRNFAREERIGSQGFASGESALQRRFLSDERVGSQQFQTGERLGGQQFASTEALKGRDWQSAEALAGRDHQSALQASQQKFAWDTQNEDFQQQNKMVKMDQAFKSGQFGKQMDLAWAQFGEDQDVNAKNYEIAKKMLEQKDMLEKLFDNFSMGNLGGLFAGAGGPGGLGAGLSGILGTGLNGIGNALGGAVGAVGGGITKGVSGLF
jgi:hypothetical protein